MALIKNMKLALVAPCGMNCNLCIAYLREKNSCPGCRFINQKNSDYCKKCVIKNCKTLQKNKMKYCSDKCKYYPCKRLQNLDKRYRTKYHMSMIDNLENINTLGIRKFVQNEKERWKCKDCGGTICVHKGYCFSCQNKI